MKNLGNPKETYTEHATPPRPRKACYKLGICTILQGLTSMSNRRVSSVTLIGSSTSSGRWTRRASSSYRTHPLYQMFLRRSEEMSDVNGNPTLIRARTHENLIASWSKAQKNHRNLEIRPIVLPWSPLPCALPCGARRRRQARKTQRGQTRDAL